MRVCDQGSGSVTKVATDPYCAPLHDGLHDGLRGYGSPNGVSLSVMLTS